jgi:DNA-binding MarR family transcriptional regulator
MSDKNLRDDMLKLVQYKILFLKRDYEHAFPEQEELVADNIDEAGYTAWKIAAFIQQLREQRHTPVPKNWKLYPPHDPQCREGSTLIGFPQDDKKYLRVYYTVLQRWPREAFNFEEKQIEVLKQIRDKMQDTRPPRAPGVREQLLTALRDRGLQGAEALAQHIGGAVADVQTAVDALEHEGQVGRWDGQYGLREQVDHLRHLSDKILQALQDKGDFQTHEQLAEGLSAEESSQVDQVLSALEASAHIQRRGNRYGLPAWSEHLPAVGDTILAVLRREQRYLSARELRDATREPLAAVRDSLRVLEAAGQVQRRGSRYGLPEW